MKKKIDFITIITSIACLIPIAISAMFYSRLPDMVATHWDFKGVANGYSSKAFASFGMPLIMLGFHLILCIATEYDPKKANTPKEMKIIVKLIIPVVSCLVQVIVISSALGVPVSPYKFIMLFMGVLFTAIGFYLPKCKQNYTIGFKLPWTLNSESNWDKTHKLAGYIWVVGGIVILISAFLPLEWLGIAVIFVMVLVPTVYSFYLYRGEKRG